MHMENKNPNRPKGRGIFNVVNSLKYLVYWFMNPFTASNGKFSTIKGIKYFCLFYSSKG